MIVKIELTRKLIDCMSRERYILLFVLLFSVLRNNPTLSLLDIVRLKLKFVQF